ncbi:hypothetical protein GCM10010970_32010 [Silvimonas iriomotensis]|uniref:Uncharacterized protein n=1 Tax=Silvimonas iriomotensis TaxID=449662 RepID=A0ABQ2PCS4_9NEIS|nr:hypothetical protein GCM10010970_32010 [Silvimonas iriomotensis]
MYQLTRTSSSEDWRTAVPDQSGAVSAGLVKAPGVMLQKVLSQHGLLVAWCSGAAGGAASWQWLHGSAAWIMGTACAGAMRGCAGAKPETSRQNVSKSMRHIVHTPKGECASLYTPPPYR